MNTAEQVSYNRIALVGAIGTLLLFPMTMIIGWQQSPLSGSPDREFAEYLLRQPSRFCEPSGPDSGPPFVQTGHTRDRPTLLFIGCSELISTRSHLS